MTIQARFNIERGDFKLDSQMVIPAQGVTALFGPSGAGKTTILRAIAGLDKHRDGFLKVGDTIWQDGRHFVPAHQRGLGYVFQEPSLFSHLTVQRNIEYGLKRVPRDQRSTSLEQVVELLGLNKLLNRKPTTLSGGERQRVAIARALATSPRLLLMDEPLAALERARKLEVLPFIETFHRKLEIPIIYVSHYPNEVARLADHLVLLETGRVKASGAVSDLLTQLDLPLAHDHKAAALIKARVAEHDDNFNLSYLDFSGGRFTVERRDLPVGAIVRLRVAARDVSLTLQSSSDTSILNIFSATISELVPQGDAHMMVRLVAGDVPVLAKITRKSAQGLSLRPGKQVFAQAKSVAVLS